VSPINAIPPAFLVAKKKKVNDRDKYTPVGHADEAVIYFATGLLQFGVAVPAQERKLCGSMWPAIVRSLEAQTEKQAKKRIEIMNGFIHRACALVLVFLSKLPLISKIAKVQF